MSWNRNYATKDAFFADTPEHASEDGHNIDVQHQREAARLAVAGILASLAVGKPDNDFRVNLSGHANPGHFPATGMGNDFISITVSQK